MTKTSDPDCVDCEGTGIDIVFGGSCTCTGKSKVKAAPVAAAPTETVRYGECADCGRSMEVGKACPTCYPDLSIKGSEAHVIIFDELGGRKRMAPAEHIARHSGQPIIGCYAIGGRQLVVGDKVMTKDGKTGIAVSAHSQTATSSIESKHYGEVRVFFGDVPGCGPKSAKVISSRVAHTLTLL